MQLWTPPGTADVALDLAMGKGLWVCDKDNLKGGGANKIVQAQAAWAWDPATGSLQQFWPNAPMAITFTVGAADYWSSRRLTWSVPGATTVSVTARVGSNTPMTIGFSVGPAGTVDWSWFTAGAQFQPGSTITYEVTAVNPGGSKVQTFTAVAPDVPAPSAAPTYTGTDSDSTVASWPAVFRAVYYEVVSTATGSVRLTTSSTSGVVSLPSPSTKYTFGVRAVVQAAYGSSSGPVLTGPLSATRSVTSTAPPATGPANGVYTIEPASNATYQWGEAGGQSAGWDTVGSLYHGDGGSASSRGQLAACFFYGTRITGHAELGNGLGSKTVSRLQIYMKRLSSGGSSSAQVCRWNMHDYASKPAGAPTLVGESDRGQLAWGEGAWIDLNPVWGRYLIDETYKGIAWGKVASRYMVALADLGLATPNGTIKITITD